MPPALARDERGVVYVEFLLAFVPLFTLFLGIAQLVLLWGGRLVVGHAASRAARTASVVLDDDPRYYDHEPRNADHGRARVVAVDLTEPAPNAHALVSASVPLSAYGTVDA